MMFKELNATELLIVDGGVSGDHIASGVVFTAIGVGLWAVALTPGLNVVAAGVAVYAGCWGISGGVAAVAYGAVK